ncbi:hypothetical protein ACVGXT_02645, partial [Enterobacter intestinihominis]
MQAQRRRANQATMRPGGLTPALSHRDSEKKKTLLPCNPNAARPIKETFGLIQSTPTKTNRLGWKTTIFIKKTTPPQKNHKKG